MHGLQIELFFRFGRDEAHTRALYSLSDGFSINVVTFVGLHIWLYVLSWHQLHIVSLRLKRASQKMRTAARLHADKLNPDVRGESQQLRTRAMLPNDDSSGSVQRDQMEQSFTQIDSDAMNFNDFSSFLIVRRPRAASGN